MRGWLYRHRKAIIALYVAFVATLTLVLQLLEVSGRLP